MRSPSEHVQPEISDARVARLWSQVRDRLEKEPKRAPRWRWALAAVAVAALALVAVKFVPGWGSSAADRSAAFSAGKGATLETANDALSVALGDGSRLDLESRTRVEVVASDARSVRLALPRGQVTCDVTHRAGRSFVVAAGELEVRVVGTRFSVIHEVGAEQSRVEVRVERGIVELFATDSGRRLARVETGQSWSQIIRNKVSVKDAPNDVKPAPSETKTDTPAKDVQPMPVAPSGSARSSSGSNNAAPAAPSDARELLKQANDLRRSGDARGAAQHYEALLQRFPGDQRAGLAAFELGRLRMDRLGDTRGAIQALEQAVRMAPGSGFREDAMARLVTAYAALGNGAQCARARDAYLAGYPRGVHRDVVARRCGSR